MLKHGFVYTLISSLVRTCSLLCFELTVCFLYFPPNTIVLNMANIFCLYVFENTLSAKQMENDVIIALVINHSESEIMS